MKTVLGRLALSIGGRIQLLIGIAVVLGTLGVTLLSYQTNMSSMREQIIDRLRTDVSLRTRLDSDAFAQAQQNTYTLREEYLHRLAGAANQDVQAEFDRWFVRYPDGLIRVRPELDDFKRQPSIYIRQQVVLTPDIRRQVLVAFNLLREWGPPMTQRYYSAYIDLPGVALIMYSPSVNWGQLSDANTNNFDYPPVRNSAPDRNPQRLNAWTEVYYDDKARIWMLSTITPADYRGQWLATTSQDISIESLVRRTAEQTVDGAYSLVIDKNNRLIVHPQMMEKIHQSTGNLDIDKLADPFLRDIAAKAYGVKAVPGVLESSDGQYYLGVGRIIGPDWYFISVYPKALLEEKAFASARIILIAGMLGVLIELVLLAWIIRRQVTQPLAVLRQATQSISEGNLNLSLQRFHNDELGHLAVGFADMADKLHVRGNALNARAAELEHEITERQQAQEALQTSVQEKEVLLKEVHYRVKNNLQVIASLLRLEMGRNENSTAVPVLADMKNRIHTLALLHETLYSSGHFSEVDLGDYLGQLAGQTFRAQSTSSGAITLERDLIAVNVDLDQAAPCGLLVNEMIANCFKHAFESGDTGVIKVSLQAIAGGAQLRLTVRDSGVGLPKDFDLQLSASFGLQLVSDLVEQIDGQCQIGPGPGAEFIITFTPRRTSQSLQSNATDSEGA